MPTRRKTGRHHLTRRSITFALPERPPRWLLWAVGGISLAAASGFAEGRYLHIWSDDPAISVDGRADRDSQEEVEDTDRIVSIERRCEPINPRSENALLTLGCARMEGLVRNDRLVLTIRSTVGGAYQVEVPVDTKVKVGDPWP